MKKFVDFLIELLNETKKDDLIALSNELSYKLLLSVFPFIIFLMTVLGFLNIDGNLLLSEISYILPDEIVDLLGVFVVEVIDSRRISFLSTSLIIAVYNSSSGFKAVIRGINKTYGQKETRSFVKRQLVSITLVFVFTLSIAAMLFLLIFGNIIFEMINDFFVLPAFTDYLFGFASMLITMFVLLFTVMLIYKLANCKKIGLMNVFPGAFVTVVFWVVSSKLFNIYIRNFSRYSKVYGSIAGVFILIIWLNLVVTLLLVGSEINAMLNVE